MRAGTSSIGAMAITVRPIAFDAALLDEVERRIGPAPEELSEFVNTAVARELHGSRTFLRVVRELDFPALAEGYREALLARDGRRAQAIVADAVAVGADVIDIYGEVLRPALEAIGHAWARDEINVADEHYASEVTARLLAGLAPEHRLPPSEGRLAIVTGSPDEQHVLGARMVADVLERAGWEVVALGAATPPDDLTELVDAERPDLVAISTSTAGRLPGVEDVLTRLSGLAAPPVVAVGGPLYTREVSEAARAWGAEIVTSDLRELLAAVRRRFSPAEPG